jgi:uncharacterized protein
MAAGPWDPRAARVMGSGHLRASDADRERVVDALKAAFVQGRLAKDEFAVRAGRALASRTYAELAALTADIHLRPTDIRPLRKPVPAGYRRRVDRKTVAWGICMLLLPTTLGAAFLTYYVGFLVLFLIAFIGVTVTAQPD